MITEKAIASQCNQRSFTRGRAIASSDRNILTKQVRYDAEESVVSAFVASSSGWDDRYRTSVILDEEADEVLDYSCTCPAFREYAGMCKHCVALALAFSQRPETFMGYQAQRTAQSSSCITEFMKRTEELLFGEMAAALGIPVEQVPDYIVQRVGFPPEAASSQAGRL